MKALSLIVTLCEPLLLTAPGGNPNSNQSLAYIPGSVLRGALIGRYLARQSDRQNLPPWFLDGRVRFLNGYPFSPALERSLPAPTALVEDKLSPGELFNRLETDSVQAPRPFSAPFAWITGGGLAPAAVQDEVVVHNARDREMGRPGGTDPGAEGTVFQYRALARGARFAAWILVPDDLPEALDALEAAAKSGPFWLGGSTSAGYGRVEVTARRQDGWREVQGRPSGAKQGEEFSLILTSDAILRSEDGQPGDFLPEMLNRILGEGAVSLVESYNRLTWVGGFNRTWGLPLPQDWAVQAGGSYLLRANRDLDGSELAGVEASGIGERTAEGFGACVFNWTLPARLAILDRPPSEPAAESVPALNEAELEVAQKIAERNLRHKLDRAVSASINSLAGTVQHREKIRSSQLARLRLQCRAAARSGEMQPLKDYLNRVEDRAFSRDQLQRVKINGQSLLAWIKGWVMPEESTGQPPGIWQVLSVQGWQSYAIGTANGGQDWQQNAGLQHEFTLRLLDGVLARVMNMEGETP